MTQPRKKTAKLVDAELPGQIIASTRENNDLPAREKIEETIVNLSTALGRRTVCRVTIKDGSTMYSIDGSSYQRGANAILQLSRELVSL